MRGVLFKIQRFIANLQNADLKTRRRWLVGLSGISMVLVVVLWVVYLNVAFPSFGGSVATTATSTQETAEVALKQETTPQPSRTSFFGTLGRGFQILGDEIKNELYSIKVSIVELWNKTINAFSKTNSYEVEKRATPQIESASTPDPIPPTPLPQP